jgi:mRNA interferase MazF
LRHGDFVTVIGRGDYETKPRPAVIIQSDEFEGTDSVTVCLLTHVEADAPLLRLRIDPTEQNKLKSVSWIMVDKIVTYRRGNIGKVFGRISDADQLRLNRSLLVFLGIAG